MDKEAILEFLIINQLLLMQSTSIVFIVVVNMEKIQMYLFALLILSGSLYNYIG